MRECLSGCMMRLRFARVNTTEQSDAYHASKPRMPWLLLSITNEGYYIECLNVSFIPICFLILSSFFGISDSRQIRFLTMSNSRKIIHHHQHLAHEISLVEVKTFPSPYCGIFLYVWHNQLAPLSRRLRLALQICCTACGYRPHLNENETAVPQAWQKVQSDTAS